MTTPESTPRFKHECGYQVLHSCHNSWPLFWQVLQMLFKIPQKDTEKSPRLRQKAASKQGLHPNTMQHRWLCALSFPSQPALQGGWGVGGTICLFKSKKKIQNFDLAYGRGSCMFHFDACSISMHVPFRGWSSCMPDPLLEDGRYNGSPGIKFRRQASCCQEGFRLLFATALTACRTECQPCLHCIMTLNPKP